MAIPPGPVDGDDSPAFGDITFNPPSPDIGSERSVQLAVHNEPTANLASVLLNVDAAHPAAMPNAPCASIGTVVSPIVIPTLQVAGEETTTVLVDTNGAFAAVDSQVLGGPPSDSTGPTADRPDVSVALPAHMLMRTGSASTVCVAPIGPGNGKE